ncbi:hypothetical protein [Desulfosporosinus shakirovi]|nr:hypothetical protein [Desulfosporosinus sp. SRJS8]MCB8817593.1 hypothetical protein [Desulfosporosinus sp. SRJS8]
MRKIRKAIIPAAGSTSNRVAHSERDSGIVQGLLVELQRRNIHPFQF